MVALHVGTLRRGCRSLQRSCPGSGAPALKDTDDVQLEEVFELCLSDVFCRFLFDVFFVGLSDLAVCILVMQRPGVTHNALYPLDATF